MRPAARGWWLAGAALAGPPILALAAWVAIPLATGHAASPYLAGTSVGIFLGGYFAGLGWLFQPRGTAWQLVASAIDSPAARDGQVTAVSGVVAPGSEGALRAPLSGIECVWWTVTVSAATPRGQPRTVERTAVSQFSLRREGRADVEVDATTAAFDCVAKRQSASTDDAAGAEAAARCLRELGVTLEAGERALLFELALGVGEHAVVVGTLQKGEAFRGAGSDRVASCVLVTDGTPEQLVARARRERRAYRRLLTIGLVLLVAGAVCVVLELVRPAL